jgi:hypothetical protein
MSTNTSSANPKPPANVQVVNPWQVVRFLAAPELYAAYLGRRRTGLTCTLRALAVSLFSRINEDLFIKVELELQLLSLLNAKGYDVIRPKTRPSAIVEVVDIKINDISGYQIRNTRSYQLAKIEAAKDSSDIKELRLTVCVNCIEGLYPDLTIECSDLEGQSILFPIAFNSGVILLADLTEADSGPKRFNSSNYQKEEAGELAQESEG